MSVRASLEGEGRELIIKVDGRFDFSAHQEFREAYEHSNSVGRYVLIFR